jgi:hypothetical protein
MCTQVAGANFKCAGTLKLDAGTIELTATPNFATDELITGSVVGGSGTYRNVGGQATITPTQTEGTSRLVVQLIAFDD